MAFPIVIIITKNNDILKLYHRSNEKGFACSCFFVSNYNIVYFFIFRNALISIVVSVVKRWLIVSATSAYIQPIKRLSICTALFSRAWLCIAHCVTQTAVTSAMII